MGKLAIFDTAQGKTTKEIIKWFTNKGHEVQMVMGGDPAMVKWADTVLFEWIDNNLQAYTTWKEYPGSDPRWPEGDKAWIEARAAKKRIVARGVDIEIYAGHFRAIDWNEVTRLTTMSDHIWDVMNDGSVDWKLYPHLKHKTIPLSVDMEEWTYRNHTPGLNVAFMGDMWWAKAPELMLQVMIALKEKTGWDWKFHVRGNWHYGTDSWFIKYRDDMVKHNNLDVTLYDYIDNLDGWLDNMDVFVTSNLKDSFSLIVAQAAAKGIPTFPHHFYGAENIYPKEWIWDSIDELVKKIMNPDYKPTDYRDFIQRHYANEVVMPLWEDVLCLT